MHMTCLEAVSYTHLADLIIGTHPHVLQSIEYITRESDGKKVLCAYSLGNFISAQSQSANLIGGILTFDITKEYENGTISVSNVLLTPTITHYTAGYKNIKLYTLDQYNETLAKAHGLSLIHISRVLPHLRRSPLIT